MHPPYKHITQQLGRTVVGCHLLAIAYINYNLPQCGEQWYMACQIIAPHLQCACQDITTHDQLYNDAFIAPHRFHGSIPLNKLIQKKYISMQIQSQSQHTRTHSHIKLHTTTITRNMTSTCNIIYSRLQIHLNNKGCILTVYIQ